MANDSIGKLSAKLTLDTSPFLGGFRDAVTGAAKYTKDIDKMAGGARRFYGSAPTGTGTQFPSGKAPTGAFAGMFSGGLGRAATALGGYLTATTAVNQLGESMRNVDRQAKLSDRLGITNEMMQRLSVAAEASGSNVDDLAKAMLHMGRTIGSGGMPLDKRFFQVADAIAAIESPTIRSANAVRIFGKQGDELLTLITQGSRGIKRSTDAIDRFGLAISRVDAAKIEEANDAITELGTVLKGFRDKMAIEIAPTISSFINDWLSGMELWKKEYEKQKNTKPADPNAPTFMQGLGAALLLPGSLLGFEPSSRGIMEEFRNINKDAAKNRNQGIDAAKRTGLGSAVGGISGHAMLAERGSMDAAKAIAGLGRDPMLDIAKQNQQALTLIERNTAAAARRAGAPMRASNLRGR